MVHELHSEFRASLRGLMRSPALTLSAVLCIGLALGATAAIWSAIDRALLQPLPFAASERLVTIYRTTPQFDTGPFSAPTFVDLERGAGQLEQMAAVASTSMLLSRDEGTYRVRAQRVTGDFFPMLRVRASRGRLFTREDDRLDASPVVVLSHELWQERFGGDERVVGSTVSLDGVPHEVVGVTSRRLAVPHGATAIVRGDAWVPMRFSEDELVRRGRNYLRTIGRLAPGASLESAEAQLRLLFEEIVEANPEIRGEQLRVAQMERERVRTVRTPLLLVLSAVGIVLLIAVSNVAALLLARGVQRQREVAIRVAIGGSRWRIMRSMLTEACLIVAGGLVLGVTLAWLGVRTIGALAIQRLPQLEGLGVDVRVVAFSVALAAVVGLLCGVIPAWRGSAVEPQEALRAGRGAGAGRGHHLALSSLVVAEVALALVLLIGAGLVLRGFAQLVENDPGFDPRPILTMEVTVSAASYAEGNSVRQFLDPALDAIRAIPGVEAAAAVTLIPYDTWGSNFNIRYEGQPPNDPTRRPLTESRTVTPDFFAVTDQRLIAGRLLEDVDRLEGAPVVVVANEALARRDFPDGSAVGRRYHLNDTTFATIVGVVSDIRNFGPVDEPRPEVYYSYRSGGTSFPLMVRVRGSDPAIAAQAIGAALRRIDPGAAITRVRPMQEVIAESLGRPRFYLTLLGAFAAVAMILAVAGLYGVMNYVVVQRTREFGIRSALGSSVARTVALVARRGAALISLGVFLGLAGGYAATRLLESLLYGVSPLDPLAWLVATTALAGVGFLAALVPASRAARVDPILAMRGDD